MNNKSVKKLNKVWKKIWPYLFMMCVALFILWSQKNAHSVYIASDSVFHTNQFYETAQQIKTGHFSWFLSLFGFHQTGRIVNAVYGPVFSYLIGGLLDLVGTWFRLTIILNFIVLSLSGMFMYHLSRSVKIKKPLSVILGVLYVNTDPIAQFIYGEQFTALGNMIMPLVVLLGIRMWKQKKVKVIPTAVLLAIIIQIHLLSAVLAVSILIPFAFASLYHNPSYKHWLKNLLLSIGLFFLLTCNIWGSLLDVFGSSHIIKPFANTAMGCEYFSFGWFNGSISQLNSAYEYVGIILISLLAIEWRHLKLDTKFISMIGFLFLFLSSTYFPWTKVSRVLPFLTQTIQLPKRFMGISMILLLLSLGFCIQELPHCINSNSSSTVSTFLMIILVFLTCYSTVQTEAIVEGGANDFNSHRIFVADLNTWHPMIRHKNLYKIRNAFNKDKNLGMALNYTEKVTPDYVPSNKPVSAKRYDQIAPYSQVLKELDERAKINHKVKGKKGQYWTSVKWLNLHRYHYKTGHNRLTISWEQPNKKLNKDIQIPLVKYGHTEVTYNHHKLSHVRIDDIGAIHLKPKHKNNTVTIQYRPALLWYLMMLIAVLSWFALIVYLII